MLLQLLYTSSAPAPVTEADAAHILATSISNNRERNITGALLHSDHHFAQLLEGEFAEVNALMRRIAADPRHHRLKLLHYASVPTRACADWSMQDINHDPALNRFLFECNELLGDGEAAAQALGRVLVEALARHGADLRPTKALDLGAPPESVRQLFSAGGAPSA